MSAAMHQMQHVWKLLFRKHSSGDLHSRLKTRKLLGVGETDDGDVHRSKLSQILGHSEQLYMRLPRGLRIWQFTTALMFSVMALWALMFPLSLFSFALNKDGEDSAVLPIRLYGAALLALSIIFWSTLQAQDREVIRWALLGSAVYFIIQFFVTALSLLQLGIFLENAIRVLSHRILFATISLYYHHAIGDKGAGSMKPKLVKSSSMKDLSTHACTYSSSTSGAKDSPGGAAADNKKADAKAGKAD